MAGGRPGGSKDIRPRERKQSSAARALQIKKSIEKKKTNKAAMEAKTTDPVEVNKRAVQDKAAKAGFFGSWTKAISSSPSPAYESAQSNNHNNNHNSKMPTEAASPPAAKDSAETNDNNGNINNLHPSNNGNNNPTASDPAQYNEGEEV